MSDIEINANRWVRIKSIGLRESAEGLILLLPPALFYSRALSEILIGTLCALFLVHCLRQRAWAWLRAPWMLAGMAWWGWLVLCSAVGPVDMLALAQSLVAARLLLLAAALGNWVLSEAATRRRLFIVISLCAAWLLEQCWQQYLFGVNIFGAPRFGDGALTGPFPGLPRAGSAYVLLFFPVALASAYRLAAWRGRIGQALGGLLLVFMVLTMVLIGQRMPTLLMLFGLVLVAWLLPQGRRPVLLAIAAAALLLAATPVISPPTFQKLVLRLWEQLSHFQASPYGLLYMRAAAILNAHPWLGAGHNAFRTLCGDPAYFHGLPWLGISDSAAGGLEACNNHPHNFYLQAATAGGYPGLLMFAAMAIAMVRTMATSAMRTLPLETRVVRLALLVQMSVAFWPLASTNDFLSIPNAGWMFLMLGWGLAEAATTLRSDQGNAATTLMRRLP